MRKWIGTCSNVACLLLGATAVHAAYQGPPAGAAGVVEKEIEREYSVDQMSPNKEIPLLEMDMPEKKLNLPEGRPVLIEHISVEGNQSLSSKEIDAVLKPYLGKNLTGKDVKELCQALQAVYVRHGYILARVYPPEQEIRQNTLIIRVIEGTIGKIDVSGNKFYKTEYIKKYFSHLAGKPANYDQIMRALLLINENSDLEIGAVFRKGESFGEVDIFLVAKDARPVHIYMDYNTWGSNITTYGRAGARIDAGNLATNGDMLSAIGVVGVPPKDLYYTNILYSAPINQRGTSFDLSYLFSHFNVNENASTPSQTEPLNPPPIDPEGLSQIGGVRFKQALNRTRKFGTDLFISFDYKQLKNEVNGGTGSFDKLRVLGVGGHVDYIDSAKGRNLFDASFYAGIPYFLGGSAPIDPMSSRLGSGGRFFILNLDYRRIQTLPWHCFMIFNATGQGTFNKLPLPEQTYIGGMGTVRGYQLAVALGDIGYCTNLEFYVPLPWVGDRVWKLANKPFREVFQIVGFIDHGGVYTNSDVESETSPTYLTSAGLGARFYGPWNLNISFDAGFPLSNPDKQYSSIMYVKVSLGLL